MIQASRPIWIAKRLVLIATSFSLWTGIAYGQQASGNALDSLFQLPFNSQAPTEKKVTTFAKKERSLKTPRDADGRFVTDSLLEFDTTRKDVHPEPGSDKVDLFYKITNPTKKPITITSILPSCGCTAAKSPQLPWTLNPGKSDALNLTVDLRGKSGVISKSVTVFSTAGRKFLSFKVHLPELTKKQKENRRSMSVRMGNIHKAMRNRQVVFQGHCRSCHYDPSEGKEGEDLFQAACGICHDTPNRASMVPDLEKAPEGVARNHNYWKTWITLGKEKTLMPAFHEKHGGPLNTQRIEKLAAFLTKKYQTSSKTISEETP